MTYPKEKNNVEYDPVKEQDSKNEDDEFTRIENENNLRKKELEKIRNLTRWP